MWPSRNPHQSSSNHGRRLDGAVDLSSWLVGLRRVALEGTPVKAHPKTLNPKPLVRQASVRLSKAATFYRKA